MNAVYLRWQVENAQKALRTRRVVAISGARQTGKTTITGQIVQDGIFRSLDNTALLEAAKVDPHEFIHNPSGDTTMVIDEIQKVPALMPEIKLAVDGDKRPGQYLITGSANIQNLAQIDDSLAGRIKHIRLRPLSVGEICGTTPSFLQRAFAGEFPVQIKGFDKETIITMAIRGGYPEVLRFENTNECKEWHRDYLNSLIQKDLYDIENIRRIDAVRDLVKICAAWSGKYMEKSKLAGALEVTRPTLDSYFNALETLFIFERVMPWIKTDYELAGKRTKIYMTDTGLMTSILNWKREDLTLNPDKCGKLIETFVFQELAAQIDLDSAYSLFQYRDAKKCEIDFLVEKEDEGLVGIEAKASSRVSGADFAPQLWFKENIIRGKMPYKGYVLYTGADTLSFGNDMWALPIAALWAG